MLYIECSDLSVISGISQALNGYDFYKIYLDVKFLSDVFMGGNLSI